MDKRNKYRIDDITKRMKQSGTAVINQFKDSDKSEMEVIYHWLKTSKADPDSINKYLIEQHTQTKGVERIYLIGDKTEVNIDSNKGRMSEDDPDLGYLSDNRSRGHVSCCYLAVDAKDDIPLGITHVKFLIRKQKTDSSPARVISQLPYAEKENYCWLNGAIESAKHCPREAKKIVVIDREGDIYDLYVGLQSNDLEFIIRTRVNRTMYQDPKSQVCEQVQSYMKRSDVRGQWKMEVKEDKNRIAHTANLSIHYEQVNLKIPRTNGKEAVKSCSVHVVYVTEHNPPEGSKPIEWILYTSLPVKTLSDAKEIVQGYKKRWLIEESFRITKTQGFKIESAQLEKGISHQKMFLITLHLAAKCLALKQTRDRDDLPAHLVFSEEQIKLLELHLPYQEGRSKKQKNPYTKYTLAWANWIVARLGGWKMSGKAGVIIFKRGLIELEKEIVSYRKIVKYLQSTDKEYW